MCGFKPVESLSEGTYRVPFDSASGEGPCLAGAREYAALSPPAPGLSFPLFRQADLVCSNLISCFTFYPFYYHRSLYLLGV